MSNLSHPRFWQAVAYCVESLLLKRWLRKFPELERFLYHSEWLCCKGAGGEPLWQEYAHVLSCALARDAEQFLLHDLPNTPGLEWIQVRSTCNLIDH